VPPTRPAGPGQRHPGPAWPPPSGRGAAAVRLRPAPLRRPGRATRLQGSLQARRPRPRDPQRRPRAWRRRDPPRRPRAWQHRPRDRQRRPRAWRPRESRSRPVGQPSAGASAPAGPLCHYCWRRGRHPRRRRWARCRASGYLRFGPRARTMGTRPHGGGSSAVTALFPTGGRTSLRGPREPTDLIRPQGWSRRTAPPARSGGAHPRPPWPG
jgi:hypothetical protein